MPRIFVRTNACVLRSALETHETVVRDTRRCVLQDVAVSASVQTTQRPNSGQNAHQPKHNEDMHAVLAPFYQRRILPRVIVTLAVDSSRLSIRNCITMATHSALKSHCCGMDQCVLRVCDGSCRHITQHRPSPPNTPITDAAMKPRG